MNSIQTDSVCDLCQEIKIWLNVKRVTLLHHHLRTSIICRESPTAKQPLFKQLQSQLEKPVQLLMEQQSRGTRPPTYSKVEKQISLGEMFLTMMQKFDLTLRNHSTSIKNLENQMEQIATLMQDSITGALPSNRTLIPKSVKVIDEHNFYLYFFYTFTLKLCYFRLFNI